MLHTFSPGEQQLNHELLLQPLAFENRYTHAADCHLRQVLFKSLAAQRTDYLHLFFPDGPPADRSEPWSLRTAQGAVDGAEYTAAAQGTACGHIFRNGESTYHCKTCASDDTCVLCSRCYESSDHEGHMVLISVSPGNSGCCDCGDREAWKREVHCSIHTASSDTAQKGVKTLGKEKLKDEAQESRLPPDLVEAIRMTIARCADYLCDVFSCSPEQLRLPKSQESMFRDERGSRLDRRYGEEPLDPSQDLEWDLVLWNDEKHTVDDVKNQVARACSTTKKFGLQKAMEVNDNGRSIVHTSRDVSALLRMAEIIEQLKVTVTIRASRDTFREQMCATIIDWISDISGCMVGNDAHLLRNTVCEELLKPWTRGSRAANADVGQEGIDDHEIEDHAPRPSYHVFLQPLRAGGTQWHLEADVDDATTNDDDEENDDDEYDEDEDYDMDADGQGDDLDEEGMRQVSMVATDAADMDLDILDEGEDLDEALEVARTYPPPPHSPTTRPSRRVLTPQDSDDGEAEQGRPSTNARLGNVPRTPKAKSSSRRLLRPSRHWQETPEGFGSPRPSEPCEDLWQRVRLDFLILYDLRLWKTLRIHLRHMYITTVVTVPRFKRILGLRFAGLYTPLAQLYLIADREPDHSIINLSVQMLTTPTITQEVVERGNFLTNLMAILYTFITTRQVGFPEEVNPKATLAFDAGAVTNRRVFHFFLDLRWLFQSELIHIRLRHEQRYLLQFLDLVKLHQGVCPNVRALGEHIEYESDTWISASLIVKEINKLCKQVAVAFEPNAKYADGNTNLQRAVRTVAQVTMINAFGYERKRFHAAELKDDLAWHTVRPSGSESKTYSVPKFRVQSEPMSFHHPLHYLLSWLIEDAKGMTRQELRALLHFSSGDLKDPWNLTRSAPAPDTLASDELLSSLFEHPLRVCAWLSQIKAGMWVRNGITLRHQAHTYRSVTHRDVGYQRDILMIQAGLVLCGTDDELPGERFLAQMIDRFELLDWFKGNFSIVPGFEEPQQLDVIEDFFHHLVIALSERGNLSPLADGRDQHDKVLQHDIAHALCFKPLSFSDLASRVTEKVGESDDFNRVLESMTIYRPPEGLQDTGTFELKPEFVELVDPYYAHYSRNHREEAENIYKKYMARKTGKKVEDVIYEPRLQAIECGLFADLAAFTSTPLFAQVIGAALYFATNLRVVAPKVQVTRVETFLHMVLHLALLAAMEDRSSGHSDRSFVRLASSFSCHFKGTDEHVDNMQSTVVQLLVALSNLDEYASCHPEIKHILRKMQRRRPTLLSTALGPHATILDRGDTSSPASMSTDDKERKKREALARQARVMAQMKQQQNSFLENQGLSTFDDDFEDDMSITEEADSLEARKLWNFPEGTCILCQEETDDQRLFGTFAFLGESAILRSTPAHDADFVREVLHTPSSLDRPADEIRPFGVASENKHQVRKVGADGRMATVERQGLSKGFPHQKHGIKGAVSTSCGHMMHFSCFELYLTATHRRHAQQIARNHPERIDCEEFICPLCKALGNTFLPIIWKAKECAPEHELHAARPFVDWLTTIDATYSPHLSVREHQAGGYHHQQQIRDFYSTRSSRYVESMFAPSLVQSMQELTLDTSPTSPSSQQSPQQPHQMAVRRGYSLSRLLGIRPASQPSPSGLPGPGNPGTPFEQTRMGDLFKAYKRIDKTLQSNGLSGSEGGVHAGEHKGPVVTMSRALGLSVTAFEIAHRGFSQKPTATSLLADLGEQNLTHLRILSETIESYLAVHILGSGSNAVARDTIKRRDLITAQLFGVDSEEAMMMFEAEPGGFLLQDDVFLFFADWLTFMGPSVAEATAVMQLCYWAETVKTVFVYREVVKQYPMDDETFAAASRAYSDEWRRAAQAMGVGDPYGSRGGAATVSNAQIGLLRLLIDKYALAFLRKCTVLMFVRYGLDFECPYDMDASTEELPRLTALLHVASVDELCGMYTSTGAAGVTLGKMTQRWLSQAGVVSEVESTASPAITIGHPAIFELVGLPRNYDTLTEEALKRRCPTTGRDMSDAAVCLQCGAVFCSQAMCCMTERNKGGCYQHMKEHGMTTGLFINIRKCMVLLAHGPGNGSFQHAPYLDRHGEPDPTLRRHHQLFLNQRRYDKLLREAWLGHLVPTVISRKLEGDINPGGWETL